MTTPSGDAPSPAMAAHTAPDPDEEARTYFSSLPTRRSVSNVLVFDPAGERIALVKPTYRDGWLLPGGTVDADESPWAAACREVHEELGLHLSVADLAVIQWVPAADPITEAIHFVFRGPRLSAEQVARIVLPPAELSDLRFSHLDEALELSPAMQRPRLAAAWHTVAGSAPVLLG